MGFKKWTKAQLDKVLDNRKDDSTKETKSANTDETKNK